MKKLAGIIVIGAVILLGWLVFRNAPDQTPVGDDQADTTPTLADREWTIVVPDTNERIVVTLDQMAPINDYPMADYEGSEDTSVRGTAVVLDDFAVIVDQQYVAAPLAVSFGGTGEGMYVALFDGDEHIATSEYLGDRVDVTGVRAIDGGVEIAYDVHGEGQAMSEDPNTPQVTVLMVEAGMLVIAETYNPTEDDHTAGEAATYTIDAGSSAYYVAQKQYFGKPGETVTGTTNDVSGTITIGADDRVSVDVTVDGTTFNSGSSGRDGDVADLLGGDVRVTAQAVGVPGISSDGDISFSIPVTMTIGGVSQLASFAMGGTVSGTSITGSGEAEVAVSGFGLSAPSAAGVYTVADTVTLGIEFSAS